MKERVATTIFFQKIFTLGLYQQNKKNILNACFWDIMIICYFIDISNMLNAKYNIDNK